MIEAVDRAISGAVPLVRRPYTQLAVCGLLLLAVLVVFGQTASHEFINFDDDIYVYENSHVKGGLTGEGIAWAITSTHAGFWHPLTTISHLLDVELFGLNRPGGHHLTNVLIHAGTAMMLFLAILRLTGALWPSAVTATLFAIHPLRVESVAWVAERKDVLSGFFFALTLLLYAGYARRPSALRYLGVAVALSLGLMCKPMLVTTPFVLLLLDYWPLGRSRSAGGNRSLGWLLREKAPLLVLAMVMSAVTVRAQEVAIQSGMTISLQARFANAAVSYVAYLRQLFWPAGLAVFYPHPQDGLPVWQALGAFGLLIAISASAFFVRRRWPYLLVGWLWYLGMLVPVLGLVQSGMQARADRFTYLPQIGLVLAIVWWAADLSRRWRHQRAALAPVVLGVVALLAFAAERQTGYWRDNETLWMHTLTCTAENAIAHNNLGFALARRGQLDDAIAHYRKALEIKPDFVMAYNNLGLALVDRGEVEEAIAQYRKALEIEGDHAETHNRLGLALASRGEVDEAIAHYRKALDAKPDYVTAHNNLGFALAGRGEYDEAIYHFRKALAFQPDDVPALNNLGLALVGRRQVDEAIAQFRKALAIQPDSAETHFNLGSALASRGKSDEAIAHYRKALEFKPGLAEAHYSLGSVLADRGDADEAIAHFRRALEIKPNSVKGHFNLGFVLAGRGQVDEALEHYREALGLALAQKDETLAAAIRAEMMRLAGRGN